MTAFWQSIVETQQQLFLAMSPNRQIFSGANGLQLPRTHCIGRMRVMSPPVENLGKAFAVKQCSGLFRSFMVGGYEGADHVNSRRMALDMNTTNGHSSQLSQDYARLTGIRTIRQSIGWRPARRAAACSTCQPRCP